MSDRTPLEEAEMSLALAEDAATPDDADNYPSGREAQRLHDLSVAAEVTMWASLSAAQSLLILARAQAAGAP